MLQKLRRLLLSDVFLSFSGTTSYAAAEGKVFAVPARLLVELPSYRIIAFGEQAREVEHAGIGRSKVIHPCNETEIFDERGVEVFLRSLFRVVLGPGFLLKPRVWLALAERTTPFMREVWTSALLRAGSREVVLVHPLLAVAAGAGVPFRTAHGFAVGELTEEGITLGLVAFGHVQVEVWRAFSPDQIEDRDRQLTVLREVWEELVQKIPPEFLGSLLREGLVLATADDTAEWAKRYSQVLELPVVLTKRADLVAGLRLLAKEERE